MSAMTFGRRAALAATVMASSVGLAACHSVAKPPVHAAPSPVIRHRHLTARRFLAFGDSLTEGLATPADPDDSTTRDRSYPGKSQSLLLQAFPYDSPTVINGGRGGERAEDAGPRLTQLLETNHPDVLLLMDGVIDLDQTNSVDQAI